MKRKNSLFYRRPNSDKYYYIKTFLRPQDHQDYQIIGSHPLLTLLQRFKSDFTLIYNRVINRYMVYKRNLSPSVLETFGCLVHVLTVHDERNLTYREPGEWVYWELLRGDLYKRGSERPKDVEANFVKMIFDPSPIELDYYYQSIQINDEINKLYHWWQKGRVSARLDQKGNTTAKKQPVKRRYFMNMKTGQRLSEQQFKEKNPCFQVDVIPSLKQKPAESLPSPLLS